MIIGDQAILNDDGSSTGCNSLRAVKHVQDAQRTHPEREKMRVSPKVSRRLFPRTHHTDRYGNPSDDGGRKYHGSIRALSTRGSISLYCLQLITWCGDRSSLAVLSANSTDGICTQLFTDVHHTPHRSEGVNIASEICLKRQYYNIL